MTKVTEQYRESGRAGAIGSVTTPVTGAPSTGALASSGAAFSLAVALISFTFAEPVFAEAAHGSGGGHGDGHHAAALFWPWVNFILYVSILVYLLRKPLAQGWLARRQSIEEQVKRGETMRREAEVALTSARQRLASVDSDALLLEKQIAASAKLEAEQIISEARERAERTRQRADESIRAEKRSAEVQLRRELGEQIFARALARAQREITPEVDRRIRQNVTSTIRNLA